MADESDERLLLAIQTLNYDVVESAWRKNKQEVIPWLLKADSTDMLKYIIKEYPRRINSIWVNLAWLPLPEKRLIRLAQLLLKHGADIDYASGVVLLSAAQENQQEFISFLIDNGADPSIFSKTNDANPVQMALREGNVQAARLLLTEEFTDTPDQDGDTALLLSIPVGQLSLLTRLVELGGDINHANKAGMTPLMLALDKHQTRLAEWLLQNGANVNAQDEDGEFALFFAIRSEDFTLLPLIIKLTNNVNHANRAGMTALMEAVKRNQLETCKLLIEAGATLNSRDEAGKTIYDYLIRSKDATSQKPLVRWLLSRPHGPKLTTTDQHRLLALAISEKKRDLTRVFLEAGFPINASNVLSMIRMPYFPPLLEEYEQNIQDLGSSEILSQLTDPTYLPLLQRHGLDIKKTDGNGNTILHLHPNENISLLRQLVNIQNNRGETPLMLASAGSYEEYVKASADPDLADEDGNTLLLRNIIRQNDAAVAFSFIFAHLNLDYQRPDGMSALHYAVRLGNEAYVKRLIHHGARTNLQLVDGRIPLHLYGNAEIAAFLISTENHPANLNTPDENGEPPLFVMLRKGDSGTAMLLLNQEVDRRTVNHSHETGLHLALKGQLWEPSILLASRLKDEPEDEYRTYLDVQDQNGRTALMWAVHHGKIDLVKFLLEAEASVDAANIDGNNALMMAPENIADLLLSDDYPLALTQGTLYDYINHANRQGNTPLLLWSQPSEAITARLLELGAVVDRINHQGQTALMASLSKPANSFRLLEETAPREGNYLTYINRRSISGDTALHYFSDYPRVMALLQAGAYADIQNNEGVTPLLLALQRKDETGVIDALFRVSSTNLRGDRSAYLNLQDINGNTALELAHRAKNHLMEKQLLEAGVDLVSGYLHRIDTLVLMRLALKRATTEQLNEIWIQETPLTSQIKSNRFDLVLALIRAGVDVNEHVNDSPLYLALSGKNLDIARALLEAGAIPDDELIFSMIDGESLDSIKLLLEYETPVLQSDLDDAYLRNLPDIFRLLLLHTNLVPHTPDYNPTQDYSEYRKLSEDDYQRMLRDRHLPVTASPEEMKNYDKFNGNPDYAKMKLLVKQKRAGLLTGDKWNNITGNTRLMDVILNHGESLSGIKPSNNLNAVNQNGQTALMLAVLTGQPDVVMALLRAGADPEILDVFGETAWTYLATPPDLPLIRLVQQYYVFLETQDRAPAFLDQPGARFLPRSYRRSGYEEEVGTVCGPDFDLKSREEIRELAESFGLVVVPEMTKEDICAMLRKYTQVLRGDPLPLPRKKINHCLAVSRDELLGILASHGEDVSLYEGLTQAEICQSLGGLLPGDLPKATYEEQIQDLCQFGTTEQIIWLLKKHQLYDKSYRHLSRAELCRLVKKNSRFLYETKRKSRAKPVPPPRPPVGEYEDDPVEEDEE